MQLTTEKSVSQSKTKSAIRDYAEAIIIALLLALVIRAFVIQAFKIPSGSMKSTLLVGDHILVNKFIYGVRLPYWNQELIPISQPERQDIIVFRYPVDPTKDFIKRVIGLPGDTVRIQAKQVFVNDQPLTEPYAVHSDSRILPATASTSAIQIHLPGPLPQFPVPHPQAEPSFFFSLSFVICALSFC